MEDDRCRAVTHEYALAVPVEGLHTARSLLVDPLKQTVHALSQHVHSGDDDGVRLVEGEQVRTDSEC